MKTRPKPHVAIWKGHAIYECSGDGIISWGHSIPDSIQRWQKRWEAMESIK